MLLTMLALLLAACGNAGSGNTASPAASPAGGVSSAASPAGGASPEASPSADASPAGEAIPEATGTAGGALPDLGGRQMVIGTDATYPPFESVDANTNEIVGFDVDLMNAIAELINIEPEFQNADFSTIFAALQSGQFDAVMSAATITPERQEIVNFSEPYIDVGQLVVVQTDNADIQSYENLADGAIVGVQTGTTGETAALEEANVSDGNLRRYQTIDVAFADLANGTIDAIVADGPTVGNYTSQERYQNQVKIVGEPFTTESYGIAVPKEDTELLNAINAALAQLKENGTIDQLREQYQIK
jgi:polar amino acid transport system substrate-binding protein